MCRFESRDGTGPAVGEGASMGMYVSGTHGSVAQGHHFLQALISPWGSHYPARRAYDAENWKADRAEFPSLENVCLCYRRIWTSKL